MTTNRALRNFRIVLWVLVAIAAIGATALFMFKPPQRPLGVTGQEFALTSTQGGTFTQAELVGTPSLVFFGYTFCPDVCPTTLAETTAWRQQLGLTPEQLRIIFVTVDPERDTPEVLKQYVPAFNPTFLGLSGTAEDISRTAKEFKVYYQKQQQPGGSYSMDHSAGTYVFDTQGRLRLFGNYGIGSKAILHDVQVLLKE